MKNLKFKNTFIKLFIFMLYLLVSFLIYRSFIEPGIVSGSAENFAPTLDIFLKDVVYEPSWHEMLSKPTHGWLYSPHIIFYILGKIFRYGVSTLIKLEYIIFCALSGFSMFILAKYMLRIININEKSKESIIACFLSGLMYMLNLSYRLGDAYYIGIQFSFSIFPLIIFFFFKAFYERKYSFAILSGFFWVEAAAFDQRYLITPLIIILPYLFIFSYNRNFKKFLSNLKQGLLTILILSLTFFLLGGYYFIQIASTITVGKTTALTKPAVAVTWSNGNVINLMRASSHFQLPLYIKNVPFDFLASLVIPGGLILTALALLSIIFYKKCKQILFFSFLLVIIVGLFAGLGELSKNFIYWIVLDSPFHHFIGRLFRTTRIPDQIVALSLSILLTFSVNNILCKLNKIKYKNFLIFSIIIFVLSLILLSSAPLLTGDVAGRLHPVRIPEGYKKANEWLLHQKGDFKVIWTPEFWGHFQPGWFKGKPADALTYYGSSKPTYFDRNNIMTHYFAYTLSFRYNSLIMRNQIQSLYDFLLPLNIKYIILHNDIPQYKNKFNQVVSSLNKYPNFILVATFDPIYIFEIRDASNHVNIKCKPVLVYGGLETGKSIISIINYKHPLIFVDEFRINLLNKPFVNIIALTSSKNIVDLCISLISKDYIIVPSHYSKFYQKNKWSRAYITDPHHGLWHSFIDSFSNQKWEFSYGIQTGFVFISFGRDTLKIPIKIRKDTNYLLFARVLKNPKGGKIKISLANLSKIINTKDDTKAEFVWVKVCEIYLTKGKYILKLENIKGSNAINILALIPEKEYFKAQKDVERLLQNKTVIYLFEAESDLYRSDAKVIKNPKASNGELIILGKNGKAWQDLEIVKNGTYRIALRGIGEFKVNIGDRSFILKSNKLNFTYSQPFYLTKGKYRLEIIPMNVKNLAKPELDVVWLYSSNKTIDQLFKVKEKPAKVVSYEKINPTLWKVKVNAKKPFMLSFAEAYDPLWEARIYKDGKLVEKVKSIPLYSVINGFWINETGNLTIIIRYTPQDWFELGLKISALTFISCIGYLFYDWRREKGDRWAKEIERKVKEWLRRK